MPVFREYDPIPAFTFHVSIAGHDVGYFTECEGLSFQRDVEEFKEGGTNDFVYMLPGRAQRGTVTLKRGVDPELELLEWFNEGLVNGKVLRDNVSVIIFDRAHNEIARFDLVDAFPTQYSGPTLRADAVAPSVESLTIAHGGKSGGGAGGGAGAGAEAGAEAEKTSEIDLSALAVKVYELMRQDARLERERLGRG